MSLLVGPGAVYGWAQYSITFWVTGRQCGRLSASLVLVRSYCSAEGWINRRALFERVLDTLKNLFGLLPHILSWVLFHTFFDCIWKQNALDVVRCQMKNSDIANYTPLFVHQKLTGPPVDVVSVCCCLLKRWSVHFSFQNEDCLLNVTL